MTEQVKNWLLEGDPSIRWQVKKDLLFAEAADYNKDRLSISSSGWGFMLLKNRGKDGLWSKGLYSPKWTSTTYTLLQLKRLGLTPSDPDGISGANILINRGLYNDGGINHFPSCDHSETCVTGLTLSLGAYFDTGNDKIDDLAEFLFGQQLADGGWNCLSFRGDTHSSFHTTASVLEGLREYEKRTPLKSRRVKEAFAAATEFLLRHRLFKSHKTGEVFDPKMTRFAFPPRWRYDIMRILDLFSEAGIPYDSRMDEAFDIIKRKEKNGKWPLQNKYPGRTWFDMEQPGKPSRWNTLRALRILNTYNIS